jgi:hypothetical protein
MEQNPYWETDWRLYGWKFFVFCGTWRLIAGFTITSPSLPPESFNLAEMCGWQQMAVFQFYTAILDECDSCGVNGPVKVCSQKEEIKWGNQVISEVQREILIVRLCIGLCHSTRAQNHTHSGDTHASRVVSVSQNIRLPVNSFPSYQLHSETSAKGCLVYNLNVII